MNCSQTVELLSEYYVEALDETTIVEVKTHLLECQPCDGVYEDMTLIVTTARILRNGDHLSYPDEQVLWQRLSVSLH